MGITESELLALRVSLALLPIDPTGLDVFVSRGSLHTICVLSDEPAHPDLWLFCAEPMAAPRRFRRDLGEVDLADTSTADRVARWAAKQVEIPSSCGVIWHPGYDHSGDPGWILYGRGGDDSLEYFVDLGQEVFADIESDDERVLPDGSRYVDRLALARWVVTLAGRVKEG